MLPFDPNIADPDWSVFERLLRREFIRNIHLSGGLEGCRNGQTPDRAAIEALLAEVYSHAWPERTRRLVVPHGPQGRDAH